MSNGGYMGYHLACNLSEKFAAIASVTGSMTTNTYDECDSRHPMPVLQIHGLLDLRRSYEETLVQKVYLTLLIIG
ncbi:MAG: hypothetical protein CM15mP126_6300 [Gammaproteobacteria bacterium]|nr:MAG: hypothetical protein CM15mP126_6300 [Gammaproteobacteria bacterium]